MDVERSVDSALLCPLDEDATELMNGDVSVPLFADIELEEVSRMLAAGVLLREIHTPSTSIPLSIARIPNGMFGPSSIRRLFWTMASWTVFSFCFCFCFFGPLRILKLRMILFSRLIG
ncbi:hypothetical protein KCV06_g50, partial [Aureobasidium melanogenum]